MDALYFITNHERIKLYTELLFFCVQCGCNLHDLGPLCLVVTCGGNRENPVKSSNNTEGHMEEAQQHGPAEGHHGGQQVFHCNVLSIIYLLLQILNRQCLKQIKW